MTCPSCNNPEVDFSDELIRDTIARNMHDEDIRLHLLGDRSQDMSLEEMILFIEAKESGKKSATRLSDNFNVSAAMSRYKNRQKQAQSAKCGYCGKFTKHGKDRSERQQFCPAFKHVCEVCGIVGHFESVCRRKNDDKSVNSGKSICSKGGSSSKSSCNNVSEENAIFNVLCGCDNVLDVSPHCTLPENNYYGTTAQMHDNECTVINIDHYVYNSVNNSWERRQSDPQPTLSVVVQTSLSSYKFFKMSPPSTNFEVTITAIADTGCQSCLAGMNVLRSLGLSSNDLAPCVMKMNSVNAKPIQIKGALFLEIKLKGSDLLTKQVVYFTDQCQRFYLSKNACVQLGLIEKDFPNVSSTISTTTTSDFTVKGTALSSMSTTCKCPKRQLPPPLPRKLPFSATEDNRAKLEKFLLKYYATFTFNTCTHQLLPMMEGKPLRLMIDKNAEPTAYKSPIPVPFNWEEDVKAGLDQDVRLGVLEPVPVGEPTIWCHHMVICPKKSGKLRRTVDLQPLNKFAKRETHHTRSPFLQARSIPSHTYKTTFDAWNGYHSVPLHPDDRHYTTFITPWGRYRYCVAPQGYIASGDGYTRRFDEIVATIPQKTKCIDDTLLWSQSIEEAFFQAIQWLDICGRHGITLNPTKFVFAKKTVQFAGFEISDTAVRPCPKMFEAIEKFPRPENLTDLRSWYGLINQVSYTLATAPIMLPFRKLLSPSQKFEWTEELNQACEESRKTIINQIAKGVQIFDKDLPTCLATDWSKTGLGFWLFQKTCKCRGVKPFCCREGWKIVLVGSRFTSDTESRYKPIEGEALAVVDSLQKARHFVLGCKDLVIAVDHKPLLGNYLFGNRSLEEIPNPRLRNLKEKSLRFSFRMEHVPGVKHRAADGLSRHPVGKAQTVHLQDDIAEIRDTTNYLFTTIAELSNKPINAEGSCLCEDEPDVQCAMEGILQDIQSITWDQVREETTSDKSLCDLLYLIDNGFPTSRHDMPANLHDYYSLRDYLHSFDNVILYNSRIVVPLSLRPAVLKTLHSAHQGVSSMASRAESSVFGLDFHPIYAKFAKNAKTVTTYHHLTHVHHQHLLLFPVTHFNSFALTCSTTLVQSMLL